MRVSANPFPFAATAPSAGQAKDGIDYGQGFESAIRSAAKDGSEVEQANRRGAGAGAEDAKPQGAAKDGIEAEHSKPRGPNKEHGGAHKVKAADGKSPKDDKASGEIDDDAETDDTANAQGGVDTGQSSADDLLARLIGGSAIAPTANGDAAAVAPKGDPLEALDALASETVLEERIVVISLEAGATEPVSDAAAGARSTVKLEVVHMETHFEPRSDAFVLVEKQGGEAAASKTAALLLDTKGQASPPSDADGGAPKLSFDEALAQLGQRKSDTAGEGDGRRGDARDDKAAQLAARKDVDRIEARGAAAAIAAKDEDGAGQSQPLASMTGQVAGRVIDALGPTLANQRSSDLPQSDTYLKMTAGGAALKTLSIQLQPEHLGRLDVSMRLVEGQLTLEIAATEASTAKVLAEDRDGLRRLLQHAGFSLDDTAITIVTRDAPAHGRVAAANDSSAAQQDGSASRNAGGGSQDRGSREPQRDGGRQDERRQASAEPSPKKASRSSATYV